MNIPKVPRVQVTEGLDHMYCHTIADHQLLGDATRDIRPAVSL